MNKKNVILAGASPDTGNLGVNALCYSAVVRLMALDGDLEFTILDYGKSLRKNAYPLENGQSCHQMGAKDSKRFYEPSSLVNIELTRNIPFLNSPQKQVFANASALLDISGGDSFTDMYGPRRFESTVYTKKLAMHYDLPLILLPQTYGPFEKPECKSIAAKYVQYASLAYARDKYSFESMRELLGEKFDPLKHHQAVDVAFLLPSSEDSVLIEKNLLPEKKDGVEVFGVNVSGLIYTERDVARESYKITINYAELMRQLVETLLKESNGDVWLIPHVLAPPGHYESDNAACEDIKKSVPEEYQSRVHVISGEYDQCNIKGVIRHCSWFTGTRMHATIAALSQEIPTLGFAYSGKFQGVFESVGQGDQVVDAREGKQEDMFERIMSSWKNREKIRAELKNTLPHVKQRAMSQLEKIVEVIRA